MTNSELGELASEVANILRGMVARYSVSQTELAYSTGVSQSQLSKMLRGVRPIDVDTLDAIAHSLGSSASEVVLAAEKALSVYDRPSPSRMGFVEDGLRAEEPHDYLDGLTGVTARLRDVGGSRQNYGLAASHDAGGVEESDF